MEKYSIKNTNGKIIGDIYFFTSYKIKSYQDRNQFVREILTGLEHTELGYAGFSTRNDLSNTLNKFIFFQSNFNKKDFIPPASFNIKKLELVRQIKDTLIRCHKYLVPERRTEIFVFPSLSKFAKKQMEGISGFAPRQDVFYLFLYPEIIYFKKRLKLTVAHEFYHAVTHKYFKKWEINIINNIITEGLANNFCIKAVNGKLTPGLIALSVEQCKKIWPSIKKIGKSKKPKLFEELFFEGKRYPLWTGYALGYLVVKSFLKKNPAINWREITKLLPSEILEKSGWR